MPFPKTDMMAAAGSRTKGKPMDIKIRKKQIERGRYKKNLAEVDINGKKMNLLTDVDLESAMLKGIKRKAKEGRLC